MKKKVMSKNFSRLKSWWNFLPTKVQNFSLVALSGSLLALSFNIGSLWFLGLIALVPLFVVLKNSKNFFEAVLYGFTLGMIYFGSVLSFFFSAHPLDWVGIENNTVSFIAVFFTWLLTAGVLAVGPALFAGVIQSMKNSKLLLFIAPTVWALAEIFQATFFSLVFAGESSLIGAHWTFGFLGYILAENVFLLSLAALGGVFFLSFIVVTANMIFYNLLAEKRFGLSAKLSAISILALASAFYFYNPTPITTKKVAALYTDFKPQFLQGTVAQESQFNETELLLRQLSKEGEHFDIIILPENTFYFSRLTNHIANLRLRSLSAGGEVLIIDSLRTHTDGPDESKLIFVNSKKFLEEFEIPAYTKQLLVPQGEYLSYGYSWLGKLFLGNEWRELFDDKRTLKKGGDIVLGTSGEVRIGAFFCSEVLTPTLYQRATKAGAGILTNSASHSVFYDSENLYQQILKYSKVRTAENGRYFVQAGNRVPSFVLDQRGELLGETRMGENSILKVSVPAFNHTTPFTALGTKGIFSILSVSLLVLFGIEKTQLRRKKK